MDLNAHDQEGDIAGFPCMEVLPGLDLDPAPDRILTGTFIVWGAPGCRIFEGKALAVLRWSSMSTVGTRRAMQHTIPPQAD